MILTESIKNSFETVIALDAQIKELTEARDKAKAMIRSELEKSGETSYNENGYYALIATGVRSTLVLQEHFRHHFHGETRRDCVSKDLCSRWHAGNCRHVFHCNEREA